MKRIQISIYLDDAERLRQHIHPRKLVLKKDHVMEDYADVVKRLLDEVTGIDTEIRKEVGEKIWETRRARYGPTGQRPKEEEE